MGIKPTVSSLFNGREITREFDTDQEAYEVYKRLPQADFRDSRGVFVATRDYTSYFYEGAGI